MTVSLGELAVRFGLELVGDPDASVHAVATLQDAFPGTIAFLANPRYRRHLAGTRATAVIVAPDVAAHCPVAALVAPNPYAAYARIAAVLHPAPALPAGIAPTAVVAAEAAVAADAHVGAGAVIEAGASVGARCVVGPGSIVMRGASLGAGTRLVARVTLYPGVRLGERCIVHAGAVIGSDGFGFAPDRDGYVKVPQVGTVVVGDDVEIGANTTIDRGAIGDTVIGNGVKLDNQIQIGHNVRIGEHTVIAACVGVSGSTSIGRRCMIAGGGGFVGHVDVCDDVVVTALTVVTKSITKPGVYSGGWAAEDARRWRRMVATLRRLARRDKGEGETGE